jgi:CRISPR-associated protein Cmr4
MPQTKIYWLHALTPLHVGAGTGLGFIDLPVMREKVTGWPLVPGSALKGVLSDARDASEQRREERPVLKAAFGNGGDENANAGALVFTDARLVCLPVRSVYGTFAWVTCSLALDRLARDLKAAGAAGVPDTIEAREEKILVAMGSVLDGGGPAVYLGDLDFKKAEPPQNVAATPWASYLKNLLFTGDAGWQGEFQKRFAIVHEDSFNYFCEMATEVNARIKMDPDRRTVDKEHGALWYEESLPAETVLAGLVWCDRIPAGRQVTEADVMKLVTSGPLQIGGKATVGRGRVRFLAEAASAAAGGER